MDDEVARIWALVGELSGGSTPINLDVVTDGSCQASWQPIGNWSHN